MAARGTGEERSWAWAGSPASSVTPHQAGFGSTSSEALSLDQGSRSTVGFAVGLIHQIGQAIAAGSAPLSADAVHSEARRHLRSAAPWNVEDHVEGVVDYVVGMGPLTPLLTDEEITDIVVNGPSTIWVDRGAGLELTGDRFESAEHLVTTVERAIAPLGLRIDRSAPMVDARLPNGSRLHAVLPPAAVDGPLLAIRRFTSKVTSLEDLVETKTATQTQVDQLAAAVQSATTIVISGGTGAGKTTLLNVLAGEVPPAERLVTIEDSAELSLPGHVVRLESRPPNTEGEGEITIRSLVRSALRLRPDRIIVGEVRGAEALDLVTALNTGHDGSLTTVHANSPGEAMWKLATLALMAGDTSEEAIRRQLRSAVGLVVQLTRSGGHRRVVSIEEPSWS